MRITKEKLEAMDNTRFEELRRKTLERAGSVLMTTRQAIEAARYDGDRAGVQEGIMAQEEALGSGFWLVNREYWRRVIEANRRPTNGETPPWPTKGAGATFTSPEYEAAKTAMAEAQAHWGAVIGAHEANVELAEVQLQEFFDRHEAVVVEARRNDQRPPDPPIGMQLGLKMDLKDAKVALTREQVKREAAIEPLRGPLTVAMREAAAAEFEALTPEFHERTNELRNILAILLTVRLDQFAAWARLESLARPAGRTTSDPFSVRQVADLFKGIMENWSNPTRLLALGQQLHDRSTR